MNEEETEGLRFLESTGIIRLKDNVLNESFTGYLQLLQRLLIKGCYYWLFAPPNESTGHVFTRWK